MYPHEKVPLFLKKLGELYSSACGESLLTAASYCQKHSGGFLNHVMERLHKALPPSAFEDPDPSRKITNMTAADLELFCRYVFTSLSRTYLLLHYSEKAQYGPILPGSDLTPWEAYEKLLVQCRSCVLDLSDYGYVLLPFPKFRNLGETAEYSMEEVAARYQRCASPEFTEKLDGSFIQARFIGDPDSLQGILMSSSGSLFPENTFQLRDAKAHLISHENLVRMVKENPALTFLFEWIDRADAHVVHYEKERWGLNLIGARDTVSPSGRILSHRELEELAASYQVPCSKRYDFTLTQALAYLKTIPGSDLEGVVLNLDGFLVKCKGQDYLELVTQIRQGLSFESIVKAVVENTTDDLRSLVPEGSEYRSRLEKQIQIILLFEEEYENRVREAFATIPEGLSRPEAMKRIEGLSLPSDMKAQVRNLYLGRPLQCLAKEKGKTIQYIRPSDLERFQKDAK